MSADKQNNPAEEPLTQTPHMESLNTLPDESPAEAEPVEKEIPQLFPEEPQEIPAPAVKKPRKKRDDPVVVVLMYAVSFLCLCITGVLAYWLIAFLG